MTIPTLKIIHTKKMKNSIKTWTWLSVYAIAMAALEAAVVVYLRNLFYGNQSELFPLQDFSGNLLGVELVRELATLVMLIAVGWMCGSSPWMRFGYFLAAFGIWDIFYYVFLYLFMQWPSGLLNWDVLFLIPLPWFGPVLAPCLISLAFILLAAIMNRFEQKAHAIRIRLEEGISMLLGCFVLLYTFMMDSIEIGRKAGWEIPEENAISALAHFVPEQYPWGWFLAGYGMLIGGIAIYYRRLRVSNQVLY